MAVGVIIGVAWIAMAVAALTTAASGVNEGRLDWVVGWGLVGVLLLTAGSISIIGTWWHQFRVLGDNGH